MRYILILGVLLIGFIFLINYWISPKPSIIPTLYVKGGGYCLEKTNEALHLLKDKASSHYDNVGKYIGLIECSSRRARSGMYPWEDPPRFRVRRDIFDTDAIWYAGAIVHDACHSQQYHDYLANNPGSKYVPRSVYSEKEAEAECLQIQYDALKKIGARQEVLDFIQNEAINTDWWIFPY